MTHQTFSMIKDFIDENIDSVRGRVCIKMIGVYKKKTTYKLALSVCLFVCLFTCFCLIVLFLYDNILSQGQDRETNDVSKKKRNLRKKTTQSGPKTNNSQNNKKALFARNCHPNRDLPNEGSALYHLC